MTSCPTDMSAIKYYKYMWKMTQNTPHLTLFMLLTIFHKINDFLEVGHRTLHVTAVTWHLIAFLYWSKPQQFSPWRALRSDKLKSFMTIEVHHASSQCSSTASTNNFHHSVVSCNTHQFSANSRTNIEISCLEWTNIDLSLRCCFNQQS